MGKEAAAPVTTPAAPAVAPATPPVAAAPVEGAPVTPPAPVVAAPEKPVVEDGTLLDDAAPKEGEKPPAAAADVEVKWPEGFKADAELETGFKGIAKELGLDSAKAQKLADFYVKAETAIDQKTQVQAKAMHEQWKKDAETHPVFGGEAFKGNLQLAKTAYAARAPQALRDLLSATKLASHPAVIEHFFLLGKADAEPTTMPGGSPAKSDKREAALKAAYPSMFNQGGNAQR